MKTNQKRIVLALNRWISNERRMAAGVFEYARPANQNWDFIIVPNTVHALQGIQSWKPHGIIGIAGDEETAEFALHLSIPFVNIYGGRPLVDGLPQIGVDDRLIGTMAAEHLINCGFEVFGYCGKPGIGSQTGRAKGFAKALIERGFRYKVFDPDAAYGELPDDYPVILHKEKKLQQWLFQLPRPIGIFACDDLHASWVADACRHLGIAIPEQVAILGVGDDDLICRASYPAISSIRLPSENIGEKAAETLQRMLLKEAGSAVDLYMEPETVVVRPSTDILAVANPNLTKALSFIREHATDRISVPDVVAVSGLSRRAMELLFHKALRRTPHMEIRRVQMECAKKLLRESDLSINDVALKSGFGSSIRFCLDFKKTMDISPGQYRKNYRNAEPL